MSQCREVVVRDHAVGNREYLPAEHDGGDYRPRRDCDAIADEKDDRRVGDGEELTVEMLAGFQRKLVSVAAQPLTGLLLRIGRGVDARRRHERGAEGERGGDAFDDAAS